jgi:uncharacterized membrane protein
MRSRKLPAGGLAPVFAAAGLAISAYLTVEHYTGSTSLSCPESETVNCARVTTSEWSRVAGTPVAVIGLLYFTAMTVLVTPGLLRLRVLNRVRVLGVAAGTAMVLYLVWAELFRIGSICLWCTGVHVCMLGLLVTVLWHSVAPPEPDAS